MALAGSLTKGIQECKGRVNPTWPPILNRVSNASIAAGTLFWRREKVHTLASYQIPIINWGMHFSRLSGKRIYGKQKLRGWWYQRFERFDRVYLALSLPAHQLLPPVLVKAFDVIWIPSLARALWYISLCLCIYFVILLLSCYSSSSLLVRWEKWQWGQVVY